jgi:hypothetical protein
MLTRSELPVRPAVNSFEKITCKISFTEVFIGVSIPPCNYVNWGIGSSPYVIGLPLKIF